MKIKLLRGCWNKVKGQTYELSDDRAMWAIRKGIAELVIEPIEPIEAKVVTEYETKVIEPEVKKRGRKAK